jgi:hypothetical protein
MADQAGGEMDQLLGHRRGSSGRGKMKNRIAIIEKALC